MLIAMAGLPGTGKTAIAEAIGARLLKPVVSVDPIESAILRAGIDADQPTGLAAYLVAETLTETVMRAGHGAIIDAVNAVDPAREQWVNLAARSGETLRFIEVVCSDLALHRKRLEERERHLPHVVSPSWFAVEQSLDEYAEWSGSSGAVERLTVDSVEPLDALVERALEFLGRPSTS
ncbi:AAA family ATPase [Conyzicola nivalis]|uniref:Adenylyl-sulfate kinase n=1 Tax=Conyzicola nivalis TaxID=1477021 RepID=A0A916SE54_9MICO|nr:AAA family ATPase [Conyzicola nivalis]GGA92266.1 adenylyl-sulfate kinase [Conyzicola nivalis]